jgi:hypothetical protein
MQLFKGEDLLICLRPVLTLCNGVAHSTLTLLWGHTCNYFKPTHSVLCRFV